MDRNSYAYDFDFRTWLCMGTVTRKEEMVTMPRYIDADELPRVKFHPLPYTHIVPPDLIGLQTDAYERGWNDAIDAIVENAETADVVERKTGKWITSKLPITGAMENKCSECGTPFYMAFNLQMNYCPNCGAKMKGEGDEPD